MQDHGQNASTWPICGAHAQALQRYAETRPKCLSPIQWKSWFAGYGLGFGKVWFKRVAYLRVFVEGQHCRLCWVTPEQAAQAGWSLPGVLDLATQCAVASWSVEGSGTERSSSAGLERYDRQGLFSQAKDDLAEAVQARHIARAANSTAASRSVC